MTLSASFVRVLERSARGGPYVIVIDDVGPPSGAHDRVAYMERLRELDIHLVPPVHVMRAPFGPFLDDLLAVAPPVRRPVEIIAAPDFAPKYPREIAVPHRTGDRFLDLWNRTSRSAA